MSTAPAEAVDLPAWSYPFRIEFLNAARDVVESIEVTGPGVLNVPALAEVHGPVSVRVTYGDGSVVECEPPR
jgi:hypothetical protein